MKKMIRQFRMPFKSNSPNLKKKNYLEQPYQPSKTGMSTTKPQKKKATVMTKPIPKSQTETGPIIKKVSKVLFRKRQSNKKQINGFLIY